MPSDKAVMFITGVSGLLGNNLAHYFRDRYHVVGAFNQRPVAIAGATTVWCDLTDPAETKRLIDDFRPEMVIHCASLTSVDLCEEDPDLASIVNVRATRNLVQALAGGPARLVYISTDSVYDGVSDGFDETSEIAPKNIYGRTKYEGELAVAGHPGSLVLRTNIFGHNIIPGKNSLAEWMLGRFESGEGMDGFTDAVFSTIYTMELARLIHLALDRGLAGIYNAAGRDSCSKFEFGQKLAEAFGYDPGLVRKSSMDQARFKAARGKNLSLNVSKLERDLGYRLPTIDQSIDAYYRDRMADLAGIIQDHRLSPPDKDAPLGYGRQQIDLRDVAEVAEVMLAPIITKGPKLTEFEKRLADYCGAKYAVAVSSGTAGLHVAALAAGVGPGDEVVTSPITFAASANCALFCGGRPVFADVDERTGNMLPGQMESRITISTKALIPVHFAGQSCDMKALDGIRRKASKKSGRPIYMIEDACHALGSRYNGRLVGACGFSDMAVMSFHPVKHITTGEGGAVLTNDEELHRRLQMFREHGIERDSERMRYQDLASETCADGQTRPAPWYYEVTELGFNYRITEIQCGLGLSQLKKLGRYIVRRREIVTAYNRAFSDLPGVRTPHEDVPDETNFHLYVLWFDFEHSALTRTDLMKRLSAKGVHTQVHYIPVPAHPLYRRELGVDPADCPNAWNFYQGCLSIPLFQSMTNRDVERVVQAVKEVWAGR